MNYIIWNEKDSRDIAGLLISELPPISKPNMRLSEITLDGVDGSTYEELGYESYNKPVRIGLIAGADVDKVIEYFTGEGKVIFSNEPQKYYVAKITGQIDFERLLRYKTATVNFRVQPFKYEYLEVPATLFGKEAAGERIQLTDKKITKLAVNGKSSQSGAPSPSAPVAIINVSKNITLKKIGKNILPYPYVETTLTRYGITYTDNGDGSVTISGTASEGSYLILSKSVNLGTSHMSAIYTNEATNGIHTISKRLYYNATSSAISINIVAGATVNETIYPQVELGTKATEYEPYKESTIAIALTEPLRSVPNGAKDVAYIKNNKLYVDRCIKSITLNGTENWIASSTINANKRRFYFKLSTYSKNNTATVNCLSNRFAGIPSNSTGTYGCNDGISTHNDMLYVYVEEMATKTAEEFATWLKSNPVVVEYELANMKTEEIGDIATFEDSEGVSNISNNANADMTITHVDNKLFVDNVGNYVSKPVMEISGAGTVVMSLNNNTLFSYTFPDREEAVIIDSQKQDAYLGAYLKNRNMSGDFPTLATGQSTITWEGYITGINVSLKSRWL